MSLAAGALSKVQVGANTASLLSAVATGGTGPYTYQWYKSLVTGFSPGAGNIIAGATALALNDSGLTSGTPYYYVVIATDSAAATANSSQLTVATLPGQIQNQFAQSELVGLIDMRVGPTNVLACQVDVSVAAAAAPNNVIYPGQGVKIVANTTGGIPKVAPITGKADAWIGFVRYNIKDQVYTSGQNLEIAMMGSVIWLYATAAITQFAEVCLDSTYVGGVQPTGATATKVGWAVDGCSAAGLIRVMLLQNSAWTTG